MDPETSTGNDAANSPAAVEDATTIEQTPATETAPAGVVEAEPVAAAAGDRAEAKRFRDAFGDKGAVWFCEGLTFEEARSKQTEELQSRVAELEQKLSAGKTSGEPTPISFQPADDGQKKHTGFAGKIRFNGQAAAK